MPHKYLHMKKLFSTLIFLLFISLIAQAQNELYQKKDFVYKGDTLHYRVLFPDNYDKAKSYPLVLFLHGAGERGKDNEKQLVHGASLFSNVKTRTNHPAIILFPQCPANGFWVKLGEKINGNHNFLITKAPDKSLELVIKLVDFYQKSEAVDSKRLYVLGISMGGMGTFDLICRYPKKFAAAIPICGGVNLERLKKIRKMPIRIYHGGSDNVVLPENSRNAFSQLKLNGSKKVEYTEFPGIGHNSWNTAFAQPDFLSWLFLQKR